MAQKQKAHWWWSVLILSILFTVVAIWIMLQPGVAFVSLTLLFTATILVSGILNLIFAIRNRKSLHSWGWFLFLGLLDLVLGIALALQPHIAAIALILYMGMWLTFKGMLSITYSFEIKKLGFKDWWWQLIGGIITVIFAFFMVINPVFGLLSVVYLTGLSMLSIGIFGIYLSFQLKKVEDMIPLPVEA